MLYLGTGWDEKMSLGTFWALFISTAKRIPSGNKDTTEWAE